MKTMACGVHIYAMQRCGREEVPQHEKRNGNILTKEDQVGQE